MKNSTALILLLLSVGLFYSFILPYYDKVTALRAQSSQYKEILTNVSELGKKRDDFEVKYSNIPQSEISRLEKVLPGNVDTVTLAMNFDSIASKYGISIKSIRTVDQTADVNSGIVQEDLSKMYKAVTVTFSFVAAYEDFRNFMADIEKSLRIIDVKSVFFDASDTGLYEFLVTVQTYWLK
ncbi:MAG: type 4a pilus biogenesis protein PilO [Patescibacteria group bacterium]